MLLSFDELLAYGLIFLTSILDAGFVAAGIALTVDGFFMKLFFTKTGSLGFLFFKFDVTVGLYRVDTWRVLLFD